MIVSCFDGFGFDPLFFFLSIIIVEQKLVVVVDVVDVVDVVVVALFFSGEHGKRGTLDRFQTSDASPLPGYVLMLGL
jgi:hypothetical protein